MSARQTVFIVDDDASIARALRRLLTHEGFRVECFASAEEFLERRDPDAAGCVLMDLTLSGMNGLRAFAALRGQDTLLPVVFLSGTADVASGVSAMKNGAIDFLTKPVEPDVLVAALRRALAVEAARREKEGLKQAAAERLDRLTQREREVFEGIVEGKLNKQIAGTMGISEKTVKIHRGRVLQKLEVKAVPDLIEIRRHSRGEFDDDGDGAKGRPV